MKFFSLFKRKPKKAGIDRQDIKRLARDYSSGMETKIKEYFNREAVVGSSLLEAYKLAKSNPNKSLDYIKEAKRSLAIMMQDLQDMVEIAKEKGDKKKTKFLVKLYNNLKTVSGKIIELLASERTLLSKTDEAITIFSAFAAQGAKKFEPAFS